MRAETCVWCNHSILDRLTLPVVQAPLAGGPSTPELAAAVSEAGGLGFVAAGYKAPDALATEIERTRALTARPFGVNVFVPSGAAAPPERLERFSVRLRDEANRAGASLGEPRFDDDGFDSKLELLVRERIELVSFTFGCPSSATIGSLREAGIYVWVTVTTPDEARHAERAGADALVAQGIEAGGHRALFADIDGAEQFGLLALIQLLRASVTLPIVASGGIATGAAIAAVLVAGATAAQLGTAFMRCPEAATSAPHRAVLATDGQTGLTRAFTGRLARGIINRFQREHGEAAPIAYPELHHMTAPIRARARELGDTDAINLWAGQTHALAKEMPAAELTAQLAAEARQALEDAASKL